MIDITTRRVTQSVVKALRAMAASEDPADRRALVANWIELRKLGLGNPRKRRSRNSTGQTPETPA